MPLRELFIIHIWRMLEGQSESKRFQIVIECRRNCDHSKPGSKRHLVVDADGIPWAVRISAANVYDSQMLEVMLDAIPPLRQPYRGRARPRRRPANLHADKEYDYPRCRAAFRQRGVVPASRDGALSRASASDDTGEWSNAHSPGSRAFVE
jgi:DDE family transposase